jgi:ABC-2 type transport system permease protein
MSALALRDWWLETRLLAGRSLRHIPRVPEKLVGILFMPLIFVVLFAYVFGSAITLPGGGDYRSYLVSGVFAQGMTFALVGMAVGVADDMHTGIVDRLRALPVARSSALAGRALSQLVEQAGSIVVLVLTGLAVGWAPHGTVLETAAAFGVMLLWAFAVAWLGTFLGMLVREPQAADGITMSFVFPLSFISAVFVPVAGLPTPLRQIAEYNPISAVATAIRQLFHSPMPDLPDVWPLQHPVLASVLWSMAIVAVFAPLAVRRYRRLNR